MSLAVRVHALTGGEERLEHIISPRGSLYSWAVRPPNASSCVVICSSVLGDFTANYHRERNLGLALAARDTGVVRFHYAGEGNSEGERSQMTFDSLCADAALVVEHARGLGFDRLAVIGTRMGSLVAAATAADQLPGAPLALWEPVTSPLRFVTEAQRAKRISQVAQESGGGGSDWRKELHEQGRLDLLGYDVYPPLIDSLVDLDLRGLIGPTPRPIFIGRFRSRAEAQDLLVDSLREAGFQVESAAFGLSESWWFHNELVSNSDDLIGGTCTWLVDAMGESV